MADQIEWVSLSVFIFFFALVTVMGLLGALEGRSGQRTSR